MIIKIKIDEESTLTFDTAELPKDSDFDSLFDIIKESNIPSFSQFKIAYAYKNEYRYCKQILDYIKTTNIRDIKYKAEIFQMSLDMIHGFPLTIHSEYSYNSYYILMGFENIKAKNYPLALIYFSKCQYKLGIELCHFYMKKNINFTNEILRAISIFNSKDVSNTRIGREMFKRNVSSDFYEAIFHNKKDCKLALNIDIKLNILSQDLSKLEVHNLNNEYFYYLRGKKEHLEKNYDLAVKFYKKSLETNYNIYAKYNLQRILQNDCIDEDFDCFEFNNFKFYMKYKKYKNEDMKCEILNINTDIKDFINIMSGIRNNPESYITKYKTLLNNKLVDKDIIKNNLIYFKNRNINYLDIVHDMDYKDNPKMQDDINTLKEIYLKSNNSFVKYNLFYLTKDILYHDSSNKYSTQIYNYLKIGELDYLEIYDKLTKAKTVKCFKDCLDSFYGANGVGICLAKSLKYEEALKVFYSLVLDYNEVYINIGNVHVLIKKYEKAIIEYLKGYSYEKLPSKTKNNEYIKNIIQSIYHNVENIDLLIRVYNKLHIKDIRSYIFKLLIEANRIEEAENYKVENKFLLEIYQKKLEELNRIKLENKRRAEEIKRYKRSKNI